MWPLKCLPGIDAGGAITGRARLPGEWLDLAADDEVVDEAAMRSWGDDQTCRATVIRDILRGRLVSDSDLRPRPHAPNCALALETLAQYMLELANAARDAGAHAEMEVAGRDGYLAGRCPGIGPGGSWRMALDTQLVPITARTEGILRRE